MLVPALALLLAACGGVPSPQDARSGASADATTETAVAAALCRDAAQLWAGEVLAAHETTVAAVRDFVADPHDEAGGDPNRPVPGPFTFPAGWESKPPTDVAASCYLDADIAKGAPPAPDGTHAPPSDRALVMATDGAPPFLVSAGPRGGPPPAPLPSGPPADPPQQPASACAPPAPGEDLLCDDTPGDTLVSLYHCGVSPLFYAGREWEVPGPSPFDAANAPDKWQGRGIVVEATADHLLYRDASGIEVRFVPDDGEPPPLCM